MLKLFRRTSSSLRVEHTARTKILEFSFFFFIRVGRITVYILLLQGGRNERAAKLAFATSDLSLRAPRRA